MDDGDSRFPRGITQHPTRKDRSSSPAFGNVVVFHVGVAILSYYALERGDYTQQDLDNIQFLHEVAVIGIGSHRVKGGDQLGYTLFAVENHHLLLELEKE